MKNNKFKKVSFNNRSKQLELTYTTGRRVLIHYRQLEIKSNIEKVWIDAETGGKSIGLQLESKKKDYLPYDQPLAIVKDPEYLLQNQIELLIARNHRLALQLRRPERTKYISPGQRPGVRK